MPKQYTGNKPDIEMLVGLEPLFEKAERKGLWFFACHKQLWFSPQELKEKIISGEFMWEPGLSWLLRSPFEYLDELNRKQIEIQKQIQSVYDRINQPKK